LPETLSQSGSKIPGPLNIDSVLLRRGSLTATITAKVGTDSFAAGNLPGIFSSAHINVATLTDSIFDNVADVNALSVGDIVSLSGMLFKTAGDPVLIVLRVRKR
jgi:hypothetical protein